MELTELERRFLVEFAAKQHDGARDNLGTMTPIHVVERIEKEFVADGSDEAWVDGDDGCEYEYFEDLISARSRDGEKLPDYEEVEYQDVGGVWIESPSDYCEAYNINAISGRFIKRTKPIAFFFIRDEAVRYMTEYQAHNCKDCRIFTYGLGYNNQGDLPVFRDLLMRMGKEILANGKI